MSDINFITNNSQGAKRSDGSGDKPAIEYSKPPSAKKISTDNEKNQQKTYLPPEKAVADSSGFFGWSNKSKIEKIKIDPDNNSFKKNKEKLAGYQDIVNNEKNERLKRADSLNVKQQDLIVDKSENKMPSVKNIVPQQKGVNVRLPKILKTNLIEHELTSFLDWSGRIKLSIAAGAAIILLVCLAYGALAFWEKQVLLKSEQYTQDIEESIAKIKLLENDLISINAFQRKLKLARELIDKHVYWTNFFVFIEKNTLRNVSYTGSFSVDLSGKYSFPAITDSYSTIDDQIRFYRNDNMVISVDSKGGHLISGKDRDGDKGVIGFNLDLNLKPSIFLNSSQNTDNK